MYDRNDYRSYSGPTKTAGGCKDQSAAFDNCLKAEHPRVTLSNRVGSDKPKTAGGADQVE